MRLLGVAGSRSGAGKTALACRLLPRLPGWGALKVSRTDAPGGHGLAGDYEIRIARTVLERRGSDTARLLAAGAAAVAWVVAERQAVPRAVRGGLAAVGERPGVLVEGNAACLALPRATVLCAVPAGEVGLKPGAEPLLARARWIVVTGAAARLDAGMRAWRARLCGDREGRLRPLALDEDVPPAWLAEVTAWSRR